MNLIIPMAGMGTRLKPHTLKTPKPMILLAGKHIVQRLVEEFSKMSDEKITDIGFIIGTKAIGFPDDTEQILQEIADSVGAKCSVYVQKKPKGTAHAVYKAKSLLEGKTIVAFADTLFKAKIDFNIDAEGIIWVKKVTDPEKYGVVKLKKGIITDFIEKPKDFVSDLAIIGIYYFSDGKKVKKEIKHLLENEIKGSGGEFQLTDVLENMKQKGSRFKAGTVDDWMDTGSVDLILESHKKVLQYDQNEGLENVSKTVILQNSKIVEPCYIGENVKITNSIIGPYVSIGDNTEVSDSNIENSLIQKNSKIQHADLKEAMIGVNVKFNGNFTRLSLGDFSELQ